MERAGWMVAVTYLEWIRWVAAARLRCVDRLTWVTALDDQAGFDVLMDRTSDLSVEDDHGYVLAVFGEGARSQFEPARPGAGLGEIWMPIDTVTSFHPLSERAHRLLEADAARAGVKLGQPCFEARWVDWQGRRRRDLARQRALMLCRALNLPTLANQAVLPETVQSVLAGEIAPPNEEKAERLRGSSAYAWALSFGLFSELAGVDARQEFSKRFDLPVLLKAMERGHAPAKPVMQAPAVPAAEEMTRHLRDACSFDLPVPLLAVVLHYRHLLSTDRPVSLESLLDDLAALGANYGLTIASIAAQRIGAAMEDAAVTTLMYQAFPEAFPALMHSRTQFRLDVGARITARSRSHNSRVRSAEVTAVTAQRGTEHPAGSGVAAAPGEQTTDAAPPSESVSPAPIQPVANTDQTPASTAEGSPESTTVVEIDRSVIAKDGEPEAVPEHSAEAPEPAPSSSDGGAAGKQTGGLGTDQGAPESSSLGAGVLPVSTESAPEQHSASQMVPSRKSEYDTTSGSQTDLNTRRADQTTAQGDGDDAGGRDVLARGLGSEAPGREGDR